MTAQPARIGSDTAFTLATVITDIAIKLPLDIKVERLHGMYSSGTGTGIHVMVAVTGGEAEVDRLATVFGLEKPDDGRSVVDYRRQGIWSGHRVTIQSERTPRCSCGLSCQVHGSGS